MEDIINHIGANAPGWISGWVRSFSQDFFRYFIAASGVFIFIWGILRPFIQSRKIRRKTPPARQMIFEFLHSVKTVAVFSTAGLLINYGYQFGIFQIYRDIAEYGWAYLGFSILFMIVMHDAYFYWTHRLLHIGGIFPRVHGLHHKSHNPTPWTAYSFDWVEAVVNFLFVKLFLVVVPMHPLAISTFLAFMIIRNAIGHSGYELFPRRWVTHPVWGQFTNVTHHDLHHATFRYNFGLYFTYWDRLMGTEHPDYVAKTLLIKGAKRKPGGGVLVPDAKPGIMPAE